MTVVLHPLSSADRARGWTPEAQSALLQRVAPFLDAEVLAPRHVQVVDLLARRAGECRPDVLLALALAVRAPGQGHVCAGLPDATDTTAPHRLPEPADADHPPLSWPSDRAAWRAEVAESPLVAAEGAPFVLEGDRLYVRRTHADELALAARLSERAVDPRLPPSPALLQQGLAALFPEARQRDASAPLDRQLLAATMACLRGFSVVSGGPGTGKTWTVRNLLTLLFAQHASSSTAPFRVAVAAPTGKAAARVQESLRAGLEAFVADRGAQALPDGTPPEALAGFLSGLTARTVHRLLRVDPRTPGRFRHHADNPLPVDVVVVDETSMLDLALMARLVEAVPPSARLVLLGDHHQLASVDAGCVLADLCRAARFDAPRMSAEARSDLTATTGLVAGPDIAVAAAPGLHDCGVQLTVSRRFTADSGVGHVARHCLAGRPDDALAVLCGEAFDDVRFEGLDDGAVTPAVAEAIVAGYAPLVGKIVRSGPEMDPGPEVHRAWLTELDRFRLLAAHRRGRLGVSGLVALTEGLLQRAVRGFRPTAGAYLGRPVLITRNDYGVGRYNGDIGLTVWRRGRLEVVFPDPEQGVVYLSVARLPPHETVFAMTIHKSQGSEFAHAAVVLPPRPSPILTRELVYTGITRARKRLTVIGSPEVFALSLDREVERASGLADRLR